MNQALLSGIASKAYDKLLKATESKQPIAVTGLPDTMAAYIASKLCADTGKKVLLISGNDLKAAHDAEDGQQLLETGVACLPGGEIDLTRGASSHESAWRRLEALARAQEGDIRLLCTSMDAALQRMGSADRFREETICLAPGDRIDLNDLIRRLTAMGYERVSMVEGKGQCALRGGIIDVYPPACSQSLRIEFFDDEVDSIREFDCISQRSLDSVEKCTLTPATEVLLPPVDAEKAARRMRDAIERQGGDLTPASSTLFSDLPPLPEDDADAPDFFDKNITPKIREKQQTAARKAELERRRAQLMADADMLAEGLPFKRIRAWLTVLTDDTYTVLDWFEPEIVVLSDPNLLRKRAEERRAGFAEDLEGAMSRDEAVKEQETLLMDWDELLRHVQGYATVAVTEFLEGMAGVAVKDAADLGVQRVAGYSSQIRPLAEDCDGWLREGYRVAVLYHSNADAAAALEKELPGVVAVQCDVASRPSCELAFRTVEQALGRVDVLVSNAGIAQQKLFTDITPDEWQHMLDVNLTGAFHLCQLALPGMIRRKAGRILTVSSMWGQTGGSCEVHYSAAKAGLIGLTKALAKEEGPSGITVNCVAPGVIDTDMMAAFTAEDKAALAEETPVGRLGSADEVARLLVFLASEDAGYITGQVFGVNGGLVI